MTQSLDGTWQLSYGPDTTDAPESPAALARAGWPTIAAQVPGNVELELQRVGLLPPDLARGNSIYLLRAWEGHRWWYRRAFSTPPRQAPGERLELVFDGLDCLATVFVNGAPVGTAANMLIPHRFDVTAALRPAGAENEVAVRLDSAVLAGRRHSPTALEAAFAANWESLAIRKAPHMYGWDILPRVVSAGLWRSVRLEVVPPTRWTDVYFAVTHADAPAQTARVSVDWGFVTERAALDGLTVRVSLSRAGRVAWEHRAPVVGTRGRVGGTVTAAELWWPRGAGAQPLYDLALELCDAAGRLLATCRQRVGLRTVRLRRTDVTTPEQPGEFVFVVNGERIFIKGTNWVPLDALHSRDRAHLPSVFAMVTDLNCNMLRCWGGNVYEDDAFFDRCDEQGVLVWQDFALACAIYPQDDGFATAVRAEAEAVVRRLRHHPALALWAGNNEIDDAYGWFRPGQDPNRDRLSRQVLPGMVRQHDPHRDYLPSSPYRSPALVAAGNHDRLKPEDHLWGPRDDFKGPYYRQSPAHFVSEIGYHGCPDRRSLEAMMDPAHVWPWQGNDQWLTHAVRPLPGMTDFDYRIPLMARQAGFLFGATPDTLDDFIFASQLSQAEAVKFFVEWFRQAKWRRTGILWWNLRDGWPVISDAVVDYYGRRKLAYAYLKRVQADVCALCAEPAEGRHAVMVVNDRRSAVSGRVVVSDLDGGDLLTTNYAVPANERVTVGHLAESARPAMWRLRWTVAAGDHAGVGDAAGTAGGENHYLAGPRPFALADCRRWLRTLGLLS